MVLMPLFAPIVTLLFLGTGFLLAVCAAALVFAAWTGRRKLLIGVLLAAFTICVLYGGLLFAESAKSFERVLGPGEKKYFCEIDCHVAYSVEGVEVANEIGTGASRAHASGEFHVVTLRTWFDKATIAPWRPLDAPLSPNPRIVYVRDAAGRRFLPSEAAGRALAGTGRRSTPLTTPLRPGESYRTYFAFDLPRDSREPRLFVGDAPGIEFLLIGHENSPLHKKIWFSLP